MDTIWLFNPVSFIEGNWIHSGCQTRWSLRKDPPDRDMVRKPHHWRRLSGKAYLELLPLLEGEASRAHLLAPAAALVRVAHHHVLVSVRVEARVDVHGELRLTGADVHTKTATTTKKEQVAVKEFHKTCFIVFKMIERFWKIRFLAFWLFINN